MIDNGALCSWARFIAYRFRRITKETQRTLAKLLRPGGEKYGQT